MNRRIEPQGPGADPVDGAAWRDGPCRLLTPRELDVVTSLAGGRTDDQIASMLGVSRRTVHKHLEHIYRKLGVGSRTAALVRIIGRWHAAPAAGLNREPPSH